MNLKLFCAFWIQIILFFKLKTLITSLPIDLKNQDLQKSIPVPTSLILDSEHPIGSFRNARDSYGNPVPLDNKTAKLKANDGKRVIEANGYLFEIPSYASGITDIKMPSDELLPPLVDDKQQSQYDSDEENNKTPIDLLPPFSFTKDYKQPQDESTNEIAGNQPKKVNDQIVVKLVTEFNNISNTETTIEVSDTSTYTDINTTPAFALTSQSSYEKISQPTLLTTINLASTNTKNSNSYTSALTPGTTVPLADDKSETNLPLYKKIIPFEKSTTNPVKIITNNIKLKSITTFPISEEKPTFTASSQGRAFKQMSMTDEFSMTPMPLKETELNTEFFMNIKYTTDDVSLPSVNRVSQFESTNDTMHIALSPDDTTTINCDSTDQTFKDTTFQKYIPYSASLSSPGLVPSVESFRERGLSSSIPNSTLPEDSDSTDSIFKDTTFSSSTPDNVSIPSIDLVPPIESLKNTTTISSTPDGTSPVDIESVESTPEDTTFSSSTLNDVSLPITDLVPPLESSPEETEPIEQTPNDSTSLSPTADNLSFPITDLLPPTESLNDTRPISSTPYKTSPEDFVSVESTSKNTFSSSTLDDVSLPITDLVPPIENLKDTRPLSSTPGSTSPEDFESSESTPEDTTFSSPTSNTVSIPITDLLPPMGGSNDTRPLSSTPDSTSPEDFVSVESTSMNTFSSSTLDNVPLPVTDLSPPFESFKDTRPISSTPDSTSPKDFESSESTSEDTTFSSPTSNNVSVPITDLLPSIEILKDTRPISSTPHSISPEDFVSVESTPEDTTFSSSTLNDVSLPITDLLPPIESFEDTRPISSTPHSTSPENFVSVESTSKDTFSSSTLDDVSLPVTDLVPPIESLNDTRPLSSTPGSTSPEDFESSKSTPEDTTFSSSTLNDVSLPITDLVPPLESSPEDTEPIEQTPNDSTSLSPTTDNLSFPITDLVLPTESLNDTRPISSTPDKTSPEDFESSESTSEDTTFSSSTLNDVSLPITDLLPPIESFEDTRPISSTPHSTSPEDFVSVESTSKNTFSSSTLDDVPLPITDLVPPIENLKDTRPLSSTPGSTSPEDFESSESIPEDITFSNPTSNNVSLPNTDLVPPIENLKDTRPISSTPHSTSPEDFVSVELTSKDSFSSSTLDDVSLPITDVVPLLESTKNKTSIVPTTDYTSSEVAEPVEQTSKYATSLSPTSDNESLLSTDSLTPVESLKDKRPSSSTPDTTSPEDFELLEKISKNTTTLSLAPKPSTMVILQPHSIADSLRNTNQRRTTESSNIFRPLKTTVSLNSVDTESTTNLEDVVLTTTTSANDGLSKFSMILSPSYKENISFETTEKSSEELVSLSMPTTLYEQNIISTTPASENLLSSAVMLTKMTSNNKHKFNSTESVPEIEQEGFDSDDVLRSTQSTQNLPSFTSETPNSVFCHPNKCQSFENRITSRAQSSLCISRKNCITSSTEAIPPQSHFESGNSREIDSIPDFIKNNFFLKKLLPFEVNDLESNIDIPKCSELQNCNLNSKLNTSLENFGNKIKPQIKADHTITKTPIVCSLLQGCNKQNKTNDSYPENSHLKRISGDQQLTILSPTESLLTCNSNEDCTAKKKQNTPVSFIPDSRLNLNIPVNPFLQFLLPSSNSSFNGFRSPSAQVIKISRIECTPLQGCTKIEEVPTQDTSTNFQLNLPQVYPSNSALSKNIPIANIYDFTKDPIKCSSQKCTTPNIKSLSDSNNILTQPDYQTKFSFNTGFQNNFPSNIVSYPSIFQHNPFFYNQQGVKQSTSKTDEQSGIPQILPSPLSKQNFQSDFTPSTLQAQPILPSSNGKYTGRFGGAPGVLGEQKVPGYAIQPDGAIKGFNHQYSATPIIVPSLLLNQNSETNNVNSLSKNEKYTGGFGGPPGFLIPYDNKS